MKKAKIAFWVIIGGFIALLAYQNWDFFMSTHGLRINLFFKEYHTPEIQNVILFLIFFCAGLLIAYFFSLLERFRSKKIIKNLTASLDQNEKMLTALKIEIDTLKTGEPSAVEPEDSSLDSLKEEKDSDAS